MKLWIGLTLLTVLSIKGLGQTLSGNWYNERAKFCLDLGNKKACLNSQNNLKINRKKDELKIIQYWWTTEIAFWRHKDVYHFKIVKLNSDTLILTNAIEFEFMAASDTIIVFTPMPCSCEGK